MSSANGIVDIDHMMVRVASLEAVGRIYERFGFFVCPARKKIGMSAYTEGKEAAGEQQKGTLNNRHIIFKPYPGRSDVANFLEFMCLEDPLNTPPQVTQLVSFLGDSEGPKAIINLSNDVDKSAEEYRTRGFAIPATIPFETGWQDEERDAFVRIQARPFVPIAGQMPFLMNCYETTTIDNYQYTPWTTHPNTARYISTMTGITNDLKHDVDFMATRFLDVEPEWQSDHVAHLRVRDIVFRVVDPSGFAELFPGLDYSSERLLPHLVGLTFVVDDMGALESILTTNDVRFVKTPNGLCVPRQEACNTLLEFVSA